MPWRDIMHRVLPPIGGLSPEVTSPFGATKGRNPPASIPHGGVDFNYPIGQTGINLKHPTLRSPVAGIVTTSPGEGTFGRIAIRDANGLSHEILHTHIQYVKRGDLIGVGQPIGRMGNAGTKDQHVHYQLKDSAGHAINPTDFWDRLGPVKTDPGQPAYLGEYQQYLMGPGANAGSGFDNAAGMAIMPAPRSLSPLSDQSASPYARQTPPRLDRRIVGQLKPSFFETGTPAVPFAPPNEVLSPDHPDSFDERFGNWTSSPAGIAPHNPDQPSRPPQTGGAPGAASGKPVRQLSRRVAGESNASVFDAGAPAVPFAPPNEVLSPDHPASLGDRFGNWTSSSVSAPDGPYQPAPPQAERPLGIVSGQPMPDWPFPPPIFALPASRQSRDKNSDDWLMRLLRSVGTH